MDAAAMMAWARPDWLPGISSAEPPQRLPGVCDRACVRNQPLPGSSEGAIAYRFAGARWGALRSTTPRRPVRESHPKGPRGHETPPERGFRDKPSIGLEPMTPSLPSLARAVIVSPSVPDDRETLDMTDTMVPGRRDDPPQ